jgi:hypothetical protein
MEAQYLYPTREAGRDFISRQIQGSLVMLNLLRFREIANYSATPDLAPDVPISGREAYDIYVRLTLPFLKESGGDILFLGKGGRFLIGPESEYWDVVMLIRQQSVNSFLAFEQNEEYMKIIGHRTAALIDSRLMPLEEDKISMNP